MKRRSFLQTLAAGVTSYALPIRTTVGEDGQLVHVFGIEGAGLYGFRIEIPAEGWCLAIFVPQGRFAARIQYMATRIQPVRVLLSNDSFSMPVDAACFDDGPHPIDCPPMNEDNPFYLKARSLTGEKHSMPVMLCIDVGPTDDSLCSPISEKRDS